MMASLGQLRTAYDIVGVPPSATSADIHRAYRHHFLLLHPDSATRCTDNDSFPLESASISPEERKGREADLRQLQHAYTIIGDATQRKLYDTQLEAYYATHPNTSCPSQGRGQRGSLTHHLSVDPSARVRAARLPNRVAHCVAATTNHATASSSPTTAVAAALDGGGGPLTFSSTAMFFPFFSAPAMDCGMIEVRRPSSAQVLQRIEHPSNNLGNTHVEVLTGRAASSAVVAGSSEDGNQGTEKDEQPNTAGKQEPEVLGRRKSSRGSTLLLSFPRRAEVLLQHIQIF